MPGHASSPYWVAVDFDSDGEEEQSPPSNHRVYLDPWDNEAVGIIQRDTDSSQEENMNSFAGEPVSASFYYVPTKNYDSGEEMTLPHRRSIVYHDTMSPEYPVFNKKISRTIRPDYTDIGLYGHTPIQERRRSAVYVEDSMYGPRPLVYEPIYAPLPQPGYLPPSHRPRTSLPHHPEHMTANHGYGNYRRHSRMTEAYEPYAYESVPPDYDAWAHPTPKTAPNNFHLSRYGHLQIDYSCSWSSLDRLIRNQ